MKRFKITFIKNFRGWITSGIVLLIFGVFGSGCSTMSTPVLRHETGETLGSGKPRIRLNFGAARIYPLVGALSPAAGIAQTGVFQGSTGGLQGAVGIHPKADFQVGGNLARNGGGWRLGAKYHIGKKGPFAFAGMVGYGAYSSSGTLNFLTAGQPIDVDQSLSATVLDVSVPVSVRLLPTVQAYGGLMYFKVSVLGASGESAVTSSHNDLGANLGLRVTVGRFEVDGEFAMLSLYDHFNFGSTFMSYYGIAVAFLF